MLNKDKLMPACAKWNAT